MSKKIIYVGCDLCYKNKDDVIGFAVAEDGTGLAQHLSSSESFSQHDMGITSNWKHETYDKHYPDGYELKWIGASANIPDDVMEKNKRLHTEHEENS